MYFFKTKMKSMDTSEDKDACVCATQELIALFDIANANRKDAWHNRLITCLPRALFTSGEPDIIFNHAGLTYYNLKLTEAALDVGSNLTKCAIPALIDTFLINEGIGIAIEASNPKQSINLSYGDVLGFHLYRTFAEPGEHPFKTNKPRASLISKGADLLINDVPAQILPTTSIKLLVAIMQHFGIKDPTIKLVYLPENEQNELVFSIDKHQFEPGKSQELLQKLGWFLPRYYSYSVCDLNSVSVLS